MRILFNSKELAFKDPFGTLVPDQVCTLNIHIPSSVQATRVECLFSREDGNHALTAPLEYKMKKGAYLLNAGRGTAIEPAALEKALRGGHLGAAALDVTEPEPLPADSPLWDLDNLILTPHVAGNFYLPETVNRIVKIACENLEAWLDGRPMRNVTRHT